MTAFDTDILVEILLGTPDFVGRAAAIPANKQAVPIVVVAEVMRGRLNSIRQAESGRSRITLPLAYELFERTFRDFQRLQILLFDAAAETIFRDWRSAGVRVARHDLRIGAICVATTTTLVTRNRRDFERMPGLRVEFWE